MHERKEERKKEKQIETHLYFKHAFSTRTNAHRTLPFARAKLLIQTLPLAHTITGGAHIESLPLAHATAGGTHTTGILRSQTHA
jgi:hypothetical protein